MLAAHRIFDTNLILILLFKAKNDIIAAFIELTVKLNENTFKPLFRKVFDWAFSASSGQHDFCSSPLVCKVLKYLLDDGNKIVFCQVYMALLDFFKVSQRSF